MNKKWTLEDDVNDYVKDRLIQLGLRKNDDFNVESAMSDHMKEALKGSSKTKSKKNFGRPDLHIEKYKIPVVFENKLGLKKLIAKNNESIKEDEKSISNYASNGAIYYAIQLIASGKYKEAVAIGVAGDNKENAAFDVYYVFGSSFQSIKKMESYTNVNFLENEKTFDHFYSDCVLNEEEKHNILITSRKVLKKYAKDLNKLMHDHNITANERVIYVSGMLLSMQDILDESGAVIAGGRGLTPSQLEGSETDTSRDGVLIKNHIKEYLKKKQINDEKMKLMLESFNEIAKDEQRDEPLELHKSVAKFLKMKSSVNKQIFTYIFEKIYKSIDAMAGHLDIVGEMYSEFLEHALGDGKDLGIVLTPPYITKIMTEILNVNKDSRVMDLAAGSAGFLISSMETMIDDAEKTLGRDSTDAIKKIKEIKKDQLLGVELNAVMYTLATTNMILRGDGSSSIIKNDTFKTLDSLYLSFKPDRLLLNPPFSYSENGMPFLKFGLSKMNKGGLAAIIIQDSAGSGKAESTNKEILKNNTLLASIKMPVDLFLPMAGVQTSIYVLEAGTPHDYDKPVKFIDFRNDGYKRTKRGLYEIDSPATRYSDLIKIYKAGKNAKINKNLWNIDKIYIEDFINTSGKDWNFEQHMEVDTNPKLEDFKKTVADYLAWEVSNILKNSDKESENLKK
ncbi:HsdM family class I SAM-dependent methyltransferase [Mycoplasmopsis opalescens]|uniref:HsdM family class I SAM-dependent methyltransferase n=1 Tax=Mycoplasmopsis opalescens TaxID=114886 RepID=UPI0004A6B01C|nr:N-6 DNA methylase [Mycoplasmopsis opalescens]